MASGGVSPLFLRITHKQGAYAPRSPYRPRGSPRDGAMAQVCSKCSRVNPPDAAYCYWDGAVLEGHHGNGGAIAIGSRPFPSQFVFPSGQVCRNFDQLAMSCQQNWKDRKSVV